MSFDNSNQLKLFYESKLGKLVCVFLRKKIIKFWGNTKKEKIMGFGFTLPYLPIISENNSCVAFIPSSIGPINIGDIETALTDETMLPARNEFFDKILVIHAAENAEHFAQTLDQFWRILAPGGKLMLIVPSKESMWRKSKTPLANGKGFSRFSLLEYMITGKFVTRRMERAIFFPPFMTNNLLVNIAETVGKWLWPTAGGIIVVEAEKVLFAPRGRPIKITPSIIERFFKPKPAITYIW